MPCPVRTAGLCGGGGSGRGMRSTTFGQSAGPGPLYWWQAGGDDLPQLVVPYLGGDVQKAPKTCPVLALNGADGEPQWSWQEEVPEDWQRYDLGGWYEVLPVPAVCTGLAMAAGFVAWSLWRGWRLLRARPASAAA